MRRLDCFDQLRCNSHALAGPVGCYPRFPTPPGPAAEPPPLARTLTGARGGVMFVLPPLLFLWWRRRLRGGRGAAGKAP